MEVVLDPYTRTAIKRELIEGLREAGLILVPEKVAVFSLEFYNAKKKVLRNKYVTPSQIAKYGLLNKVKTIRTVKHMVADGRITPNEWFRDAKGHMQILTVAIRRLNGE